jgi:hypothetical protein
MICVLYHPKANNANLFMITKKQANPLSESVAEGAVKHAISLSRFLVCPFPIKKQSIWIYRLALLNLIPFRSALL